MIDLKGSRRQFLKSAGAAGAAMLAAGGLGSRARRHLPALRKAGDSYNFV